MANGSVDIKISGNKFKILLGLIIGIGTLQTYILGSRQVTHAEMVHVLDSLHHRQLLFTHSERQVLSQKIDLAIDAQNVKIGQIIVRPLDKVLERVTILETRINDRIDRSQNATVGQGVDMNWQLYRMNQKLDSLPGPAVANPPIYEKSIPQPHLPERIRN